MKDHELKNSLLKDAAECQRRNGLLPDTNADDVFWQEQLNELDRRKAEAKPRSKSDHSERAEELVSQSGATLLGADEARRELDRLTPKRTGKTVEGQLACKRLAILRGVPEWRQKVWDAINRGARNAHVLKAKDMRLCIWLEVRKVLDESNKALGRWDAPPEQRIQVG